MIINNYEGKLSLVQKSMHLFMALRTRRRSLGDGFCVGAHSREHLDVNQNRFIHSQLLDIFRTSYDVFPGVDVLPEQIIEIITAIYFYPKVVWVMIFCCCSFPFIKKLQRPDHAN